jgi:hypothetical protein
MTYYVSWPSTFLSYVFGFAEMYNAQMILWLLFPVFNICVCVCVRIK